MDKKWNNVNANIERSPKYTRHFRIVAELSSDKNTTRLTPKSNHEMLRVVLVVGPSFTLFTEIERSIF